MTKQHHFDSTQCPDTIRRITDRVQERAYSSFELPRGWLFKGQTFYFNRKSSTESSDEQEGGGQEHLHRLNVTANIARFAGAAVVSSLKDIAITHVIIDPDTSSTETSEFRRSLSTRGGKKVPHIVTRKWIEECWGERTLLDEESKFSWTLKGSRFFGCKLIFIVGFQPAT